MHTLGERLSTCTTIGTLAPFYYYVMLQCSIIVSLTPYHCEALHSLTWYCGSKLFPHIIHTWVHGTPNDRVRERGGMLVPDECQPPEDSSLSLSLDLTRAMVSLYA